MNKFIKGFTSRTTATAVAMIMMLSSLASFAMLISIVTAETPQPPIEPVPHTARYRMVASGDDHSFGIRYDGSLWGWGYTAYLGTGIWWDDENYDGKTMLPVRIGSDNDWKFIDTGWAHTLGIRENGSLWAWGSNRDGQLGLGDNGWDAYRTVPTLVCDDYVWTHVSANQVHTLGIREDGSLWAWGGNFVGQLGLGEGQQGVWEWDSLRTIPTLVCDEYVWTDIAAGTQHSMGVREDGSLWTWGRNTVGQLGLGDTVDRLVPTRVGEDYNWASIAGGRCSSGGHSLGLRTDGTLWSWGGNSRGELGLGYSDGWGSFITHPTQVGEYTDWTQVSAGIRNSLGIRSDGSLWGWGEEWCGKLGNGDTTEQHSPVQAGTETGWAYVSAGGDHTLLLRPDGSLWVCGWNSDGQLGIGNYGYYNEWDQWRTHNILTPFGPTPEQLEPLPKDPPPDLSYVNIGSDDDNKAFVDIDEERIEDEKLTFRWWRRVGNGEWEELDVPPNQPWVDIELDDDEDVTYKVDIYVDNEFLLARERIFNPLPPSPPTPQNRFYGFAIPTAIAICIAFVCLITLIVIIIVRRREDRKRKKTA